MTTMLIFLIGILLIILFLLIYDFIKMKENYEDLLFTVHTPPKAVLCDKCGRAINYRMSENVILVDQHICNKK